MRIVIVRHGETEYNKLGIIQGQSQVPLNERGRAQAAEVAEFLKHEEFNYLYCSGLKRAQDTAEIINKSLNLRIIADNRLNERNYGTWENKKREDLIRQYPDLTNSLFSGDSDSKYHNGESVDELKNRSIEFFNHIISEHRESDVILVVTHGGPIKMMLGYVNGLAPEEYFQQAGINNGQIFKIEYKNRRFKLMN